jgi:hypothetical protein
MKTCLWTVFTNFIIHCIAKKAYLEIGKKCSPFYREKIDWDDFSDLAATVGDLLIGGSVRKKKLGWKSDIVLKQPQKNDLW